MRGEKEIIDSVMEYGARDENVRAVVRTDLLPVREYLYSYSFTFIVNNLTAFEGDGVFASCFGERVLLFRGDRSYPALFPGIKAHLMVLKDGITLVVSAASQEAFLRRYRGDLTHENVWIGGTYQKLLDKDGILTFPDRLEETQTLFSHLPDETEFSDLCCEFWWVMKTFAEYAARQELPPALFYLNTAVRDPLLKMLRWHILLREGQPVDMGILDSNLEKLLEEELFSLYRRTYADADWGHIRAAFDAAAALWGRVGRSTAEKCGFCYDDGTEAAMLALLRGLWEKKG